MGQLLKFNTENEDVRYLGFNSPIAVVVVVVVVLVDVVVMLCKSFSWVSRSSSFDYGNQKFKEVHTYMKTLRLIQSFMKFLSSELVKPCHE